MPFRDLLRRSVNLVPWRFRAHVRRVPLVAGLQRWVVARWIGGAEFEHVINAGPARGLRVRVSLPRDKALWTGAYETDFVSAIAAAVPPGGVCLDVGGFRGFVSGVMALKGADRVTCFEPLPANLAAIRFVQTLNPTLPIEVRPHAVGAADGQAEFQVMGEESMGKLTTSPFQPGQSGKGTIAVAVRTLDSLLAAGEISPPALVKIDVEGAEGEVIAGAARLLREHRPHVFLEAHSPELRDHCTNALQAAGYGFVRLLGGSGASADAAAGVFHLEARGSRDGSAGKSAGR